jgi:hypothetical protein
VALSAFERHTEECEPRGLKWLLNWPLASMSDPKPLCVIRATAPMLKRAKAEADAPSGIRRAHFRVSVLRPIPSPSCPDIQLETMSLADDGATRRRFFSRETDISVPFEKQLKDLARLQDADSRTPAECG